MRMTVSEARIKLWKMDGESQLTARVANTQTVFEIIDFVNTAEGVQVVIAKDVFAEVQHCSQ